jgi:hypothetical protein
MRRLLRLSLAMRQLTGLGRTSELPAGFLLNPDFAMATQSVRSFRPGKPRAVANRREAGVSGATTKRRSSSGQPAPGQGLR